MTPLFFQRNYFLLGTLIFLIELGIAMFVHDRFIRPFVGDVLVVVLLYCFVKSFWNISYPKAALLVLFFAYGIELLQYFDFVEKLGLQDHKILAIALGSTFDWLDLLAYTIGIVGIYWIEKRRALTKNSSYH